METNLTMRHVEQSKMVAYRGHALQVRRDGKTPYTTHIETVARLTKERMLKLRYDYASIIVGVSAAYLHDIVEDWEYTGYTFELLEQEGIPSAIIEVVKLLTKEEGLSYEDNIDRVLVNRIATQVKISDNLANLSDSPSDGQIIKYSKSLIKMLSQ